MPLGEVALNAVVNGLIGLAIKTAGDAAPEKLEEIKRKFHDPAKQYVDTYLKRHGQIQVLGLRCTHKSVSTA